MSPQQKNLIYIGILVLLLIIIGVLAFFLWKSGRPVLPTTTGTSTPTVSVSKGNVQDINAPATHITQHQQYYDIDLQYPSNTALSTTAGASANSNAVATLKNFSQHQADQFIADNNLNNLTPKDIQMQGLDQGRSYSLTDEYHFYSSPTTISYLFNMYADTLGAHPNTYFQTFTFDAKTGDNVTLADLFTPGSDYLGTLSTISRRMLTAQLGSNGDQGMITAGTQPNSDNFSNFALDGSNLVIFFPPYQVAAYAAGPQTIKIPLNQLKNILK